jgi:threonine/homoserine/homoserine lactone efflux protein
VSTELADALRLGAAAFLVGLSGAMSPGSYLTVTIARTMQRGPWSAALMLVGHALLEAVLLLGFAFGLAEWLRLPTVLGVLGLIGGAVLLWMGAGLLRGALNGSIATDLEAAEDAAVHEHPAGAVAQGAIVSLSNPYWTLWWATIGVKLAADGLAIGPIGVAAFFIGHQLADITWYVFVIYAVHAGKGLLSPRLYRGIIGSLAVFLLYLGARFALEPLGVHLPWF